LRTPARTAQKGESEKLIVDIRTRRRIRASAVRAWRSAGGAAPGMIDGGYAPASIARVVGGRSLFDK